MAILKTYLFEPMNVPLRDILIFFFMHFSSIAHDFYHINNKVFLLYHFNILSGERMTTSASLFFITTFGPLALTSVKILPASHRLNCKTGTVLLIALITDCINNSSPFILMVSLYKIYQYKNWFSN